MSINRKSTTEFIAIFQQAPEGGFTVTVPALPGCISEGDTFEEAELNIREAIELYIEMIHIRRKKLDDLYAYGRTQAQLLGVRTSADIDKLVADVRSGR